MNGFGDLAAAAKGDPVDGSNDGFCKRLQARCHRLTAPDERLQGRIRTLPDAFGKLADVATGRKRTIAGSGQHNGMHTRVVLYLVENVHQAIDQRIVQGVQLFGTIESQQCNRAALFGQYQLSHVCIFHEIAFVSGANAAGCQGLKLVWRVRWAIIFRSISSVSFSSER